MKIIIDGDELDTYIQDTKNKMSLLGKTDSRFAVLDAELEAFLKVKRMGISLNKKNEKTMDTEKEILAIIQKTWDKAIEARNTIKDVSKLHYAQLEYMTEAEEKVKQIIAVDRDSMRRIFEGRNE